VRGPKPTPIEQRIKEGNPHKRPLPQTVLVGGRPDLEEFREPPPDLPVEAQEFWRDTVLELINVGIVDRVDRPVLRQIAIQYARIAQAQRVLAEQGHYVRGSVGQLREHPALKIERDATSLFMKMAEHYGLTPVARTRLGLAELQRRSLKQELEGGLKAPKFKPVPLTDDDPDEIDNVVDAEVVA
jgi:P27 family predicted phage terminase small subunit